MTMIDARVDHVESETVAYLPMRGPYAKMPEAFGTLYGWIQANGLTPKGMPRTVYLSDPATTPEADAAWELQTALVGEVAVRPPDASGCGVNRVEARDEAWTVYRGPYDGLGPTYGELVGWIAANGYAIAGPPSEVYLSDPAGTAPEDYLTEVRFPVRRTP